MRKITTLFMLISLFSFGYMVPSSYAAMEPMAKGLSSPNEVGMLTGSLVVNGQEEYLGTIHDFVIDKTGRISFAILSHGGFLGIGRKLVAIPFGALSYDSTRGYFFLDISRDRLETAPEFDRTRFISTAWAEDVYRFFGLQPYWTEGGYGEEVSPTTEQPMEKPIGSDTMSDFSTTAEEYLSEHQYLWP
jgi:hypothetical protein